MCQFSLATRAIRDNSAVVIPKYTRRFFQIDIFCFSIIYQQFDLILVG